MVSSLISTSYSSNILIFFFLDTMQVSSWSLHLSSYHCLSRHRLILHYIYATVSYITRSYVTCILNSSSWISTTFWCTCFVYRCHYRCFIFMSDFPGILYRTVYINRAASGFGFQAFLLTVIPFHTFFYCTNIYYS
jgi:hypothetical protein